MGDGSTMSPATERSEPDDPPHYCSRCTSMLSLTGLRALSTREGFEYYTRSECLESAVNGCALCKLMTMWNFSNWKNYERVKVVGTFPVLPKASKNDVSVPIRVDRLYIVTIASEEYKGQVRICTSAGEKSFSRNT